MTQTVFSPIGVLRLKVLQTKFQDILQLKTLFPQVCGGPSLALSLKPKDHHHHHQEVNFYHQEDSKK